MFPFVALVLDEVTLTFSATCPNKFGTCIAIWVDFTGNKLSITFDDIVNWSSAFFLLSSSKTVYLEILPLK